MKNKVIRSSLVFQQDQADCGVACLLSVVNYHGGYSDLEHLKEISGTTRAGTTLLGLFQAAKRLNFRAEGRRLESIEQLKTITEPAILHVKVNANLQHYVVCYKFDENQFTIGDPAKGVIQIDEVDLESVWQSRVALFLAPEDGFITKTSSDYGKYRFIRSLLSDDIPALSVAVILGVIISILGLSVAVFSQKLVDSILPGKDFTKLISSLVLFAVVLLLKAAFSYFRGIFIIKQSKNFNIRLVDEFFRKLIFLPKSFFDTRRTGDLVSRMNDAGRIQNAISFIAGHFVIDLLITISSLSLIYYYNPWIGSFCLLSSVTFFLVAFRYNSKISDAQKEVMIAHGDNESNYVSTIQGIDAIKTFNKESFFITLTSRIYGFLQGKIETLGILSIRSSLFYELIGVAMVVTVTSWSSVLVFHGLMNLGEMIAAMTIVHSIAASTTGLVNTNIQLQEAKVAFDRLYAISSQALEYEVSPHLMEGRPVEESSFSQNYTTFSTSGRNILKDVASISVIDFGFSFPGRSTTIRNISFSAQKGQLVTIVGGTGSGKSTLLKVMQKFYAYDHGQIIIDSTKIEDISHENWRNVISNVPQDVSLFDATVFENIHLWDIPSDCFDRSSMEATIGKLNLNVLQFCKNIGLDQYFSSFPNGYNTVLGVNGIHLSGGQQQLIAFARALYRKPKVLFLDEATSGMDETTENCVLEILSKAKKTMIIIMVTHRKEATKFADVVYNMASSGNN